jgi:hypothetical protein
MAYELIEDFQWVNSKKQISIISKGVNLGNEVDGYFEIKIKGNLFRIEKDIVLNNPQYFKKVDLVSEVTDILKNNKKTTAPRLAKILADYIDESVLNGKTLVDTEKLVVVLTTLKELYFDTNIQSYGELINSLGYTYDRYRVYPSK